MKNNYVHMICYMYIYIKRVVYRAVCYTEYTTKREYLNLKKNIYESVRIMCTCTRERVLKFVHYTVVSYNCYIPSFKFCKSQNMHAPWKAQPPYPETSLSFSSLLSCVFTICYYQFFVAFLYTFHLLIYLYVHHLDHD